jgi:flagellar FliL protein
MAKEQEQQPQADQKQPPSSEAPLHLKKLALLGIPLFLLQLGLAYVVTVKFIVPSPVREDARAGDDSMQSEEAVAENEQPVFHLKEVLVNPAGTNGTRFLLTSLGFEVSSEKAKQELERKEVQLRDIMNSILTRKTLPELINYQKREEIRNEIIQESNGLLKSGSIKKVYFSKFIVQ